MHLPRPEPSYPIQHTSIQPCKGKLRKDVQGDLFLYLHFKAPLWLPPFWLTFQLQNSGMQPESCTQSGEDVLPTLSPKVWAQPQQKKGLVPSSVCCLHKQLFGKRFYIFHSRTTLSWINLQVLRSSEKQMISKRKSRSEEGKPKIPQSDNLNRYHISIRSRFAENWVFITNRLLSSSKNQTFGLITENHLSSRDELLA